MNFHRYTLQHPFWISRLLPPLTLSALCCYLRVHVPNLIFISVNKAKTYKILEITQSNHFFQPILRNRKPDHEKAQDLPEGIGLCVVTTTPEAGASDLPLHLPWLLSALASLASLTLSALAIAIRIILWDTLSLTPQLPAALGLTITVELNRAFSSWSNLFTREEIELRINSLHPPSWRAIRRKLIHSILSTWKNQRPCLIGHHRNQVCDV